MIERDRYFIVLEEVKKIYAIHRDGYFLIDEIKEYITGDPNQYITIYKIFVNPRDGRYRLSKKWINRIVPKETKYVLRANKIRTSPFWMRPWRG